MLSLTLWLSPCIEKSVQKEITTSMTWCYIKRLTGLKYSKKVRTWERQETSHCNPEQGIWAINLEKWEETSTPAIQLHASMVLSSHSPSEQTYYLWWLMPSWLDEFSSFFCKMFQVIIWLCKSHLNSEWQVSSIQWSRLLQTHLICQKRYGPFPRKNSWGHAI